MENYIQISLLNDFAFCPRSIYFHHLYEKYADKIYKDKPQVEGTANHANIDQEKYSTSKNILQGMSVFCEKYNIGGKIDLFEIDQGYLIERKTRIRQIFDGYKYQVYGQYFCLKEMGYSVKKIFLHSFEDNKRYEIPLPGKKEIKCFEKLLTEIRSFDLHKDKTKINPDKCANCIYAELCDICEI